MKNPYDRLSRAISYALHPLIVPTIAALLLLFGPTVMSNLPAEARWFIAAVILLNTLILPAFSLAVLKLYHDHHTQQAACRCHVETDFPVPARGQPQSRSGRGRCGGRRSRHGGHRAADLTQALFARSVCPKCLVFQALFVFLTGT